MISKHKLIILILHAIGLFLAYGSLSIFIFLLVQLRIPMLMIMNSNAYSEELLIGLTIVGMTIIYSGKYLLNKILAYLYLLLWLSTILKIIFFTW